MGQGNAIFAMLQNFGKALMLPIAILPAAGLLLGIGNTLSNPNALKAFDFLNVRWLQMIFIKKRRNTPSFSYGDISRKNLLTLPTNSSKIASAVRLPL